MFEQSHREKAFGVSQKEEGRHLTPHLVSGRDKIKVWAVVLSFDVVFFSLAEI